MNNIKERMATAISPVDLITGFAKLKNALATIATTMTCNPVKRDITSGIECVFEYRNDKKSISKNAGNPKAVKLASPPIIPLVLSPT